MLETISLISAILAIIMLRRIVEILPYVFACILRTSACIKIDSIVKISRSRDMTALVLILPLMMTIQKYNILPFRFLSQMSPEAGFAVITAIFAAYYALRVCGAVLFIPNRSRKKSRVPDNSDRTFFIILAILALSLSWIMSLMNISHTAIRLTIIWISAATYALYLIRKLQIFQSSHSIFAAFLYLCALEIVPSGILVVAAIIF